MYCCSPPYSTNLCFHCASPLVPYVTPKMSTLLCIQYHTFSSCSSSSLSNSDLIQIKRFCLYCPVLWSYGHSNYLSALHWIFFQVLIWGLHFEIPFVSFCLIVLTLYVMLSASLKNFFANFIACFLSSPSFCNLSSTSQQQYCQQQVLLSFFSVIFSVFMRDTILLNFTVAALTFILSVCLRLSGFLSGSHQITFTFLINSSFSSSLELSVSSASLSARVGG